VATLIDGKAIAAKVRADVRDGVLALLGSERGGEPPGLAVVLVGQDPASQIYVRNKGKAAREAGLLVFDHTLPATTSQGDLLALVEQLNRDARVDGILVQMPLPAGIDPRRVMRAVSPWKDVDGFHPENLGLLVQGEPRFVACTPAGVMVMLEESKTPIAGVHAVVIGRSNTVGRPMALLLTAADATVTVCHSKTRGLDAIVRSADIVVAAIGRAELVKGDWIKPGATVIDVGMNRTPAGKLLGDVEFAAASERAAAITPVPGGVGPMTIALLLKNTLASARRRGERPRPND
jgi:methylenetetrahydrofolate dehydrogenase (NADP+) / methenyltetrahydrofolate cyclohydrolase